jgi:hypothetical protein
VDDNLNIHLIAKTSASASTTTTTQTQTVKTNYDTFFEIPLIYYEAELLSVPDTEYDADFAISTKKICELTSQMMQFGGSDIDFICNDEKIDINTSGINGNMKVTISTDDLDEYSISEGEVIELSYSLAYLNKVCLSTKISTNVNFSVSANYPMKMVYELGENSSLVFFLSPKIKDNED